MDGGQHAGVEYDSEYIRRDEYAGDLSDVVSAALSASESAEGVGNAFRAEIVFRLVLLLYSFVEDTFTQERGSKKEYQLFFLYFSSCSTYLFNILDLDLHHRIDILST